MEYKNDFFKPKNIERRKVRRKKEGKKWSYFPFPPMRVYFNSCAPELISIQPLTGNSGLIFYLDYEYKSIND